MLYLLLFSVLAIGFVAATTMSVQIARNDRSAADAQSAAESGMQVVRQHLGKISVSPTPTLTDDALLQAVAHALGRQLNGSADMHGRSVSITHHIIALPAVDDTIILDPESGTRFQVNIAASGPYLWVKVVGQARDAAIRRAIQMRFDQGIDSAGDLKFKPVATTYEEVTP